MSKTVTYECGCGCGEKVVNPEECGWFTLKQMKHDKFGNGPKIEGKLRFSSLTCLRNWSQKAERVLPGLQEMARGLSLRGSLYSDQVLSLYI